MAPPELNGTNVLLKGGQTVFVPDRTPSQIDADFASAEAVGPGLGVLTNIAGPDSTAIFLDPSQVAGYLPL